MDRWRKSLDYVDRERLMAVPGCGLGMLIRRQVKTKLANQVAAGQLL